MAEEDNYPELPTDSEYVLSMLENGEPDHVDFSLEFARALFRDELDRSNEIEKKASLLVLQRRFKEECPGMYEGRLGAWHGSVWPVRCILASPPATAAAHSARTVPGAAFPAPPGRLGAG